VRKMNCLVVTASLLAACNLALAQATKPAETRTVGQVLDRSVTTVEKEFVPAADAMPEDKYSFAPTNGEFKGVRTFAQQVKHVAAVNYMVAAAILGEKPPVELGSENGPDSMPWLPSMPTIWWNPLRTLLARAQPRAWEWPRPSPGTVSITMVKWSNTCG
jgi:hypothetical protein